MATVIIRKPAGKTLYQVFEEQEPSRYLTWDGQSAADFVAPARFPTKRDARIFAECHGHVVVKSTK